MYEVIGFGKADSLDDEGYFDKSSRDSNYVKLSAVAVAKSLKCAQKYGYDVTSIEYTTGVACLTDTGDGQCEKWCYATQKGDSRARPRDFGGLIHNSAAGRIAIEYGLHGPQLVIVEGRFLEMVLLYMELGKTNTMIVFSTNEQRQLHSELGMHSVKTVSTALIIQRVADHDTHDRLCPLKEIIDATAIPLSAKPTDGFYLHCEAVKAWFNEHVD